MKTITAQIIVTESGKQLHDKEDGIVVYGCILKGDNHSGLFGSGQEVKKFVESGGTPVAYTVEEFIRGLHIDPFVLKRLADQIISEKDQTKAVENQRYSDDIPGWAQGF